MKLRTLGPTPLATPVSSAAAGAAPIGRRRRGLAAGAAVLVVLAALLAAGVGTAAAQTRETSLVSTGPVGGNGAFDVLDAQQTGTWSTTRGASVDATRVFFRTAERLVAGDTDTKIDLYERFGGQTTLVSTGPAGGNGNFDLHFFRGASADGTRVWFMTAESLVEADTDENFDVYERFAGQTALMSIGSVAGDEGGDDAFFESASADGTRVVFSTNEALVEDDVDTVTDIYERFNGETELVSTGPRNPSKDWEAHFVGASADGARIFFLTLEALAFGDNDTRDDVYERHDALTTRLSVGNGATGNGPHDVFSLIGHSADGTSVFFRTTESLATDDTDTSSDIYARSDERTTLVSTGPAGGNGSSVALFRGVSTDGSRVFFESFERLVADDTDASSDIYERSGGQTTLLSTGPAGGNGEIEADFYGASADGTRVFIGTNESLVAGDTDASSDLYERSGGQTTLLSIGPVGGNGEIEAGFGGTSADGTRVFFETSEALVTGDTDAFIDVYERSGGQTTLVSAGNGGFVADFRGASADGTRVFYMTSEALVADDTDATRDLYKASFDTAAPVDTTAPAVNVTDGPTGTTRDSTPTFGFTAEDGATLACGVDGAFGPCDSATSHTTGRLGDGPHTFAVRAIDAAGNGATASRTFTVDTAPPATAAVLPTVLGVLPSVSAAVGDRTRPVISAASLSRTRLTTPSQMRTIFRITLSEAATVSFRIERSLPGKRSRGGSCVKPTRALRRGRDCRRYFWQGTFTRTVAAGMANITFTGRLRRKPLKRGRYRAVIVATDAAGNRSEVRTLGFTVVKRTLA